MRALEPQGIGTGQVESLSSYVQRLARWHGTNVGQLLHRWIAHTAAGEVALQGRWRRRTGSVRLSVNMNGFRHAEAWLKVLNGARPACELKALTTRPWDDIFTSRGFFSTHLKFCPCCLSEDPDPYYRLSWSLQPVVVCSVHRRRLTELCPRCKRVVPAIHERSVIGRCPQCAGIMITGDTATTEAPTSDHLWMAEQVTHLICTDAHVLTHAVPLSGERLRGFAGLRNVHHLTQLARFCGLPKNSVWSWWHGENDPGLNSTLALARTLGLGIRGALCGDLSSIAACTHGPLQLSLPLLPPRKQRILNWRSIQRKLTSKANVPLLKAQSLHSVGRELGVPARTLRERSPELCRTIGSKWRTKQRVMAVQRYEDLKGKIAEAVQACRRCGVVVSQQNVARALNRPGLFSRPNARRALAEVLAGSDSPWPKVVTFPTAFRAIRLG